jgi:hypothetical protein
MKTSEIKAKLAKLRPDEKTLSNLKAVSKAGSITLFTAYKANNVYFLASGIITSTNQPHKVVKRSCNWGMIEDHIMYITNHD